MMTVSDHYAHVLAPVYLWMLGGIDAALAQAADEVAALGAAPAEHALAVDLGAGVGAHAIALARHGYDVLAIDSSPLLLEELRRHSRDLPVRAVQADLLAFRDKVASEAHLILCMGDTLTHLEDTAQVVRLVSEVSAALVPGGRFMATFRDYARMPAGADRFIPVRSDADRIHTCFLEEQPEHVVVYDVLHERDGAAWQMRVGSYRKLRLSPQWVVQLLRDAGLAPVVEPAPRGMVRVTATRQ